MNNPSDIKISVIFPTLNEESCIAESVRAMKSKLTAFPSEIIVSDGKSTDRTVELARAAGAVVLEYKEAARQNIAQGRNAGGKAARGEFVVFMDADSRIEDPNSFFMEALKRFDADLNLVALTARLKVYPDSETFADKVVWSVLAFNLRMMNNVFHKGESTGEFQMIRKSAFDRLGGFREDLVTREDADMFLRLSKIGRTMWDGTITVFHSGRRAHKIGWPKLLSEWIMNTVWVMLFNKAKTKEWTVVR